MAVAVSVIMPVYNSQEYVREAIQSVLNQNFQNFELILVDDGSKDHSGQICDEMALQDKRIKVIHKENGGICSARNAGLRIAQGEYIAFCDNDDEYLPDLLKDNYEIAVAHKSDIVRFGRQRITSKNGEIIEVTVRDRVEFQVIDSKHFVQEYGNIMYMGFGVWTGLYNREFLMKHNIHFCEKIRFGVEDCLFNFECYQYCPSIAINPKSYYCWKQRLEHSTSGILHSNFIDSLILCMEKEEEVFGKLDIRRKKPGLWQKLIISEHYYDLFTRLSPEICSNTNKEKKEILAAFRKRLHINFSFNLKDIQVLMKDGVLNVIAWLLIYTKQEYLLYRLIVWKKKIKNRKMKG